MGVTVGGRQGVRLSVDVTAPLRRLVDGTAAGRLRLPDLPELYSHRTKLRRDRHA